MTKNCTFLQDIDKGLSHEPKFISSHYFYDKAGDQLFQQIMEMPEYYLTDAELDIFSMQTAELINSFGIAPEQEFELIELGAGDGKKTQHLLRYLFDNNFSFKYIPVDISRNSLEVITKRMTLLLPALNIEGQEGDYFQVLDLLFSSAKPKVVMFIGSNLGNMEDEVAKGFLAKLAQNLKSGEKLLLGVDLIKSADIVLPAYHDAGGITSAFNLNLLRRINRELGADFNVDHFEHAPEYDEREGIAKSFLRSRRDQKVYIQDLQKTFHFSAGECIHTEISRKYNTAILTDLLEGSGLEIRQQFLDSKCYFADYILKKR